MLKMQCPIELFNMALGHRISDMDCLPGKCCSLQPAASECQMSAAGTISTITQTWATS